MAISISYGIAFASLLTLFILPIFLSFNNSLKGHIKWLKSGERVPREELENAIKELKAEHEDEINQ